MRSAKFLIFVFVSVIFVETIIMPDQQPNNQLNIEISEESIKY